MVRMMVMEIWTSVMLVHHSIPNMTMMMKVGVIKNKKVKENKIDNNLNQGFFIFQHRELLVNINALQTLKP